MKDIEFNLIDQPWIKVLTLKGQVEEVSLLTILTQAQNYQRLANELAVLDVAIMRLLLAIMHACLTDEIENKTEALAAWQTLWRAGKLPQDEIEKYLAHYHEQFWLFHPQLPFYQVPYLNDPKVIKATPASCEKLIGDLSVSGHKPRLFLGRTQAQTISFAEAARWLLFYQGFGVAFSGNVASKVNFGKNQYELKSNGAAWLGKLGLIWNQGTNLLQTLLLNFVLYDERDSVWARQEATVWEDETARQPEVYFDQAFTGQSQKKLLTMQSRSILLLRDSERVTGYLAIKGGKGFNADQNFSTQNVFLEQMTVWKNTNDIWTAKRHQPARQLWRDAASIILAQKNERHSNYKLPGVIWWRSQINHFLTDYPVTIKIASLKYEQKDCIITDAFSDELQINHQVFSDLADFSTRIENTVATTEAAVSTFATLAANLALASGADEEKNKIISLRNNAKETAYFALDLPFRKWLLTIKQVTNYSEQEIAWKKQVRVILYQLADDLLKQTPESAHVGRKKGERWLTLASSDNWFRSRLVSDKVLNLVVKKQAKESRDQ